jgi:hypothetical protein
MTASRSTWLAFGVSGFAALCGLARHALILHLLGLSSINDRLQVYLAVIYGVSMLNEAVRLGTINLLQREGLPKAMAAVLPLGLLFALVTTGIFAWQLRPDSALLLLAAGVSGWLNMVMIQMVTHRQRAGAFWPAHLVSLMPNLILLPGIAVVAALQLADPVPALAWLHFVLPVVQIAILLLVRVPETPATTEETVPGSRLFLAHGSAAIGSMLFQSSLRSASLLVGPGALSLVNIGVQIYDSLRFILVDTYIGRKLADWKESTDLTPLLGLINKLLLPQAVATGLGLVIAVAWAGQIGALVVLVCALGSFGLRLVYFMANAARIDEGLIWRYGAQDIAAGLLALTLVNAGGAMGWAIPVGVLVWVWYLAKPLAQTWGLAKRLKEQPA